MRYTFLASILLWPAAAQADVGYAIHAEGAAAHMVGERKVDQFGWGGGGLLAPELTLGDRIGLELPIGALALSEGEDEPGFEPDGVGVSLFALPGLRLRPFGRAPEDGVLSAGGLWLAGGGGVALTGELTRAALGARVGYDLFASSFFRGGPTGGFLQIIETESVARPEDARMLLVGLHGAIEPTGSVALPADDDGDGILGGYDRCPEAAEDPDGFRDGDGCPDRDNDRDGYADADDDCPNDAEDVDGDADDDGCPDADSDDSGEFVTVDACPGEPETVNGYADDDGCPDVAQVRVVGSEIVLDERVYFHVNGAEVEIKSWGILERVAELLAANPSYGLVRVQGHADDTGDSGYNANLSVRRGQAVREALIRAGVAGERLVVEGFGEDEPELAGTSTVARSKNRRVAFLILRRDGGQP
jgi:outer membrane protein OmpA-like peptidoglycan-associated protein